MDKCIFAAYIITMDNLFSFSFAWIWLAIMVIFVFIEAITFNLTTIWFALGALVMIFVSFTKISFPIQILVWLILSSIILYFSRPFAVKKLKAGKEKTNVDSLIGQTALVVKSISKHEKGEIKINGIIWTAKSLNEEELKKGSECKIVKIEGVTAFVE